jgi:GTP-binding protein
MVDGVLLLVDASEGPLPQTRFVLGKALEAGLPPVVCLNKIDRADARPAAVLDEIYGLFIDLGATEAQLDFSVVYTNARAGTATLDLAEAGTDLRPLFATIVRRFPVRPTSPTRLSASRRTTSATTTTSAGSRSGASWPALSRPPGSTRSAASTARRSRASSRTSTAGRGLKRVELDRAVAGDIVAVAGVEDINIGETVADRERPEPLPPIRIDEPTITMVFSVNTSPWAGRSGDPGDLAEARERLFQESRKNVSLRVEETATTDAFRVLGRGELQLAILIETMRREGYELPGVEARAGRCASGTASSRSRWSCSWSTCRRSTSAS